MKNTHPMIDHFDNNMKNFQSKTNLHLSTKVKDHDWGSTRRLSEVMYAECDSMLEEWCKEHKLDKKTQNEIKSIFEKCWGF